MTPDYLAIATAQAKAYRDEILLARDRAKQAGLRSETAAPTTWVEAGVVPSSGRESGQLRKGDE